MCFKTGGWRRPLIILLAGVAGFALDARAQEETRILTPQAVDPRGGAVPPPIFWTPQNPLLGSGPGAAVLKPWKDLEHELYQEHKVALNIFYTLIYQYASAVTREPRDLLSGRFDLAMNWELLHIPNVGHSQFQFLLRSGQVIGHNRNTALGRNAGVISGINNLRDEEADTFNIVSWTQGLFDDRAAIVIGKIHPNQYIDLSPVANDESKQFIGGPFDGTQTIPNLGNYTPGVAVLIHPNDEFYTHTVLSDTLGSPQTGVRSVLDGFFTVSNELGWTPQFNDDLKGQFRIINSHSSNRLTEGYGFALSADMTYKERFIPFVRWGRNFATNIAPFKEQFSAGFGIMKPFGRGGDMFGAAVAWSRSNNPSVRQETMLEVFYRIQVTDMLELTPDLQFVFNPGAQPASDLVVITSLRLRFKF